MEKGRIRSFIMAGAGNVGAHLGVALTGAGLTAEKVYSRTYSNAGNLSKRLKCDPTDSFEVIAGAKTDLLILALPDEVIMKNINKLSGFTGIIIHTSGSLNISVLSEVSGNCGVFYPLQTFTKHISIDFSGVPVCIEASNDQVLDSLQEIAERLKVNATVTNSEQRANLHLSAVMAANFTNYLLSEAEEICIKENVNFRLLEPLLKETIRKAFEYGASASQTGPARRGESVVLDKHAAMLDKNPVALKVYQRLSTAIMKKYHGNF